MIYLALLRGINVGGNNMIKMAELKICLEKAGFTDVKTYIQSGNIIFKSAENSELKLAEATQQAIKKQFGLEVSTLVIEGKRLQTIAKNIPEQWGEQPDWKYNVWFVLPGCTPNEVIEAIGPLKPDIEALVSGDGVVYQSMSIKMYGKTTTGKLPANKIYKKLTIRNLNTTKKLAALCAD